MFRNNLIMSIACLVIIISFSCGAQPVLPKKISVKKGNEHVYKIHVEEDIELKTDTPSTNVLSNTTIQLSISPVMLHKDSIRMLSKIRELRANIKGYPGAPKKNVDTVLTAKDLENQNFHFLVSGKGKFMGIQSKTDSSRTGTFLPYITQFLSGLYLELPAGKIAPGNSWKGIKVDTIRQGLSKLIINMPVHYTFTKKMDTLGISCAEIMFQSTAFDISLQDELMKIFNLEYTLNGEGSVTGRLLLDLTSGTTVAIRQESNTSYILSIKTQSKAESSIPMRTSQKLNAVLMK